MRGSMQPTQEPRLTRSDATKPLSSSVVPRARLAPSDDRRVHSMKADKMERSPDHTLRATGNVHMQGSRFQLRADSVEVHEGLASGAASVEIVAKGHVVLTRGQERLTIEHLQLNPQTGAGAFQLPEGKD